MTRLSRREQKAIARAQPKSATALASPELVGKGIKEGILNTFMILLAVAVFPFWLMYQNFAEWRERRRENG